MDMNASRGSSAIASETQTVCSEAEFVIYTVFLLMVSETLLLVLADILVRS